jgi:hypothetical protein
MPQRPSRDNNARNNKQRAQQPDQHRHGGHRASPSLSPPAQLPTPLPDDQIPHFSQLLLPATMDPPVAHPQSLGSPFNQETLAETSSSRLIDFDTPPFQLASLPAEEANLDDQEDDDSGGALGSTYRSPPFREAPLPIQVGSPPPLPIPPRIPYPQDYFEDVGPNDPVDVGFTGHVRSPTFSRYVLRLLVCFLVCPFSVPRCCSPSIVAVAAVSSFSSSFSLFSRSTVSCFLPSDCDFRIRLPIFRSRGLCSGTGGSYFPFHDVAFSPMGGELP